MTQSYALSQKRCKACEGGVAPLEIAEINAYLKNLSGWRVNSTHTEISKQFHFPSFLATIAFVNAVAWMTNQENHHPQLIVGYDHCTISYTTHAIRALSENDFICAAKIEQLITVEEET